MRIWYLSSSLVPSRAANSVHVMKMAQAFSHNGHAVTLYAWKGDVEEADAFGFYGVPDAFRLVRVRRLPIRGAGKTMLAGTVVRDLLLRRRPDVLYARNPFALYHAGRFGVPLVQEVHNPPGSVAEERAVARLLARRNFYGMVTISHALAGEYLRLYPTLEGRILVAPDGADEPARASSPPTSRNGQRPQIGYIGQLYAGKGVEVVVRLAAMLPEMDFHVVGGGEEDVAAWRTRAEKMDGYAGNLRFHGHVPHGRLDDHFAAIDVFVAPYQSKVTGVGGGRDLSRWMSPLKLFEYMAAGKPIVCSDLPVLREVLTDEVDALLVPPDDLSRWAESLRRLTADPSLRERLGTRAFNHFRERHTWTRRAERISEFIQGSTDPDAAESGTSARPVAERA